MQFHEPDIYNYSALLLSEDKDTLYIGAREAVFAVNALNISEKQHEVRPGLPCMSTQPGLSGQPLLAPPWDWGLTYLEPLSCSCDHAAPCLGVHQRFTQGPPALLFLFLNFLFRRNLKRTYEQRQLLHEPWTHCSLCTARCSVLPTVPSTSWGIEADPGTTFFIWVSLIRKGPLSCK